MSPRSPRLPERSSAELATRRAIRARDVGLRRIAAITRGIGAAVVALSGAFALIAANGFHGHTTSVTAPRVLSGTSALTQVRRRSTSSRAGSAQRATRAQTVPSAVAARASATSAPSQPAQTPPSQAQTPAPATQTTAAAPQTTQTAAPASSAAAAGSASAGSSSSLATPTQSPAPTPAAPVVVSGGS